MAQNVPGYSFPRMPDKWTEAERQFALALRSLFDTIFSDQETQNRTAQGNADKIAELLNSFTKAIKDINSQLAKNSQDHEGFEERLDNLEDFEDTASSTLSGLDDQISEAIEGAYDDLYPVGCVVISDSSSGSPLGFGTWELQVDGDDEPLTDGLGHYYWERVSDE